MSQRGLVLRFGIVALVLGAHTLRNVSLAGYLTAYGLVAAWSLVSFLRSDWRRRLLDGGATFVVWCAVIVAGAAVTWQISGMGAAVNGLSRFVFAMPIFFALAAWTPNRSTLLRHVGTLVGVFTFLSLTLPLQFLTGPIPFFAEPSMRGGEIRYASAVGSLTSIGIVVGCYIVLAQTLRPRWRWPLLILMTLPAVASLSKAAIANVALAWIIVLWLNRRNRLMFTGALVGLPLAAVSAYLAIPALANRVESTLLSFGLRVGDAAEVDDVSVGYSMMERLALLPAENWKGLVKLGNDAVYLVGGGFGMADTALVSGPQGLAMMAHNQMFESLSVFGLLGGLVQWGTIFLLFALLLRRHQAAPDGFYGVFAVTFFLLILNSGLANGTLYQPLAGAVLYLLFFVALARLDDDLTRTPPLKESPWSS